jgi:hypothetical protein
LAFPEVPPVFCVSPKKSNNGKEAEFLPNEIWEFFATTIRGVAMDEAICNDYYLFTAVAPTEPVSSVTPNDRLKGH